MEKLSKRFEIIKNELGTYRWRTFNSDEQLSFDFIQQMCYWQKPKQEVGDAYNISASELESKMFITIRNLDLNFEKTYEIIDQGDNGFNKIHSYILKIKGKEMITLFEEKFILSKN